jgi:signal transduction histidine kinase
MDNIPAIPADPVLLRQAFLNILLNSCEAMEAGGILKIRTNLKADEKIVQIIFHDNGKGIDPEDLPKIFDPFYTTKGNRTGLGLSVAYGIVQAHQGTIDVQSTLGVGTSLTIKLPTAVVPYKGLA